MCDVAHRCACGLPDVVATEPRLPDGTPFPTTFYLTCPRATAAASMLESEALMVSYGKRIAPGGDWHEAYLRAHDDYLTRRAELGEVGEIAGISAGGMPDRVKCLHALIGHSLAAGPGVNPVGDAALAELVSRGLWPAEGATAVPCAPPRVAAIDCGTNSIRLLIVEFDPRTGRTRDLERIMTVVRLGEGVDATGVLSEAALTRTFAACEDYAARIAARQVTAVRFVATSASRDAANREEFTAGVLSRIGVEPEVISGEEEARLSFLGATSSTALGTFDRPALVVDIGGGSTEFVIGDATPRASASVNIGCVRLAERHLRSDPPTPAELAAIRADARAAVATAAESVPLAEAATLIGLAGTVTTVAALAMGLSEYDAETIHGARIGAADVARIAGDLGDMSLAQRRALSVMHPGRADVIVSGAIVLDEVVRAVGLADVLVSEHDILDGIAADLLGTRRRLNEVGDVVVGSHSDQP
jgi:exopolyphosphatase/guanosine-5'-triphosphate,3'-diphosphate pyrophosphatase